MEYNDIDELGHIMNLKNQNHDNLNLKLIILMLKKIVFTKNTMYHAN